MTIEEAKAVIYGNVGYACEKAGFSPYTTKLVQDACDMIIAMADRKTKNSSEKPNNCDTCRFELYWPEMCEGCCEWDSHYEPKDEPQTEKPNNLSEKPTSSTISKMEQVDKDINVRSKDEPQTNADQHVQHVESVEPMQTERSSE